ncbi:hypothetical protein HX099_10540 [Thiopseudomonas alkaliphila]|uniref:Uncharacterized protein n=1 Tax=Thiopseudomonas alkaliphila TaxID=1697053 RepID=A0AAW7DWL3_9GAMM|nr:hypothetical protein [Thiopseudomonas alkaliphila]MDM1697091.1 hypothetical protein [Thiopseudomonas alkaliphila]
MNKVILAVAVTTLLTPIMGLSATREECIEIEPLAEKIMIARQSQEKMSSLMLEYEGDEAAQFLIVKAFSNHIAARNKEVQQKIIDKFVNYAFLQCIKDKVSTE